MLRRFLVTLLQRSFLFFLLICLGCSAQSAPRRYQGHRAPGARLLQVTSRSPGKVGPLKPSEFPNYDAVKLTMSTGTRKRRLRIPALQRWQDARPHDQARSHQGSQRRHHEEDRPQGPADARQQRRQGHRRQLRRLRVPLLLAHAPDPVSRRFSRSTATASCSCTRTIRWRKFIPGPFTPRSMQTAWRRRTTTPTGT